MYTNVFIYVRMHACLLVYVCMYLHVLTCTKAPMIVIFKYFLSNE